VHRRVAFCWNCDSDSAWIRLRRLLPEMLLEPVVCVGLVVERVDLAVSRGAVEAYRLGQGLVRLEPDHSGAVGRGAVRLRQSYGQEYEGFCETTGEPGRPLGYLFLEKSFQLSAAAATPLHARTLSSARVAQVKNSRCSWGRPHSSPRPLSIALEANLRPRAAALAEGLGVAWLPGLVRRGVASPVEPMPLWHPQRRGIAAQHEAVLSRVASRWLPPTRFDAGELPGVRWAELSQFQQRATQPPSGPPAVS
jgi:hypothetical protein